MTPKIIEQVNQMGQNQGQGQSSEEWLDDTDDELMDNNDGDGGDESLLDTSIVDNIAILGNGEDVNTREELLDEEVDEEDSLDPTPNDNNHQGITKEDNEVRMSTKDATNAEQMNETESGHETDIESNQDDKVDDSEMVEDVEPSHNYNLRDRKDIDYSTFHNYGEYQLSQIQKKWYSEMFSTKGGNTKKGKKKSLVMQSKDTFRKIVGVLMSQMTKEDKYAQVSVEEGVRQHGEQAIEAVLAEFTQLNDHDIFYIPKHNRDLTADMKKEALNLITLVEEKRCGKIKGRACEDG